MKAKKLMIRRILFGISLTLAAMYCTAQVDRPLGRRFPRLGGARGGASGQANPRPAARCGSELNAGYRVRRFASGVRAGIWYPATAAENTSNFAGLSAAVAGDAPVAGCERYPLVVFSHGFGGCGIQSVFFTEALARHGYIVVAPDHKDANCSVERPEERPRLALRRADEPFRRPEEWTSATYFNRRQDVEAVIDEMLRSPEFGPHIDAARIGGAGHSLGGYTMLGLAGGWENWKDPRIKAILLFSPYAAPYLVKGRLRYVNVPLMYQGGRRDLGVTPGLAKPGGAYDESNPPKYFVEFAATGHLDWSDKVCMGEETVENCAGTGKGALINEYGIAFLDEYLKGERRPALTEKATGVIDLRYQLR